MNDEQTVKLQIAVARMEGMLHQALMDQGKRISNIEAELGKVNGMLSEKGKMLATHAEQIRSNYDRIGDLENKQHNAASKNAAVIAVVVAAAGLLLTLARMIPWDYL